MYWCWFGICWAVDRDTACRLESHRLIHMQSYHACECNSCIVFLSLIVQFTIVMLK